MAHVKTTERSAAHGLLSRSDDTLTEAGRLMRNVLAHGQTDWSRVPQAGAPARSGMRSSAAGEYAALGVRLLKAGRSTEAIPAFRQAIAGLPDDAALHHDLGLAYAGCGRFADAAASFQAAVRLKDDLAAAHYQLGCAFEMLGADVSAIEAYRRAGALTPSHVLAHQRAGAVLKRLDRTAEAIECFDRAAATRPETATSRVARAQALVLRGHLAEAERWFRRALAQDPHDRYVITEFGLFLSQQGRLTEAVSWLLRVCQTIPVDAFAFFNLSSLSKFTEADRPWLDRIAVQAEAADEPALYREVLHFGLGKAFDDLGDDAAAMQQFDAGNQLAAARARFDQPAMVRAADRLIAAFVPGAADWDVPPASEDATPLLIVGMPRSGTTLVEQIVSSHPHVGAGGELAFWDERRASAERGETPIPSTAEMHEAVAEYCALLRRIAPGKARVTDKLPFNLFWVGPIHRALPNARFIHCRRHPLDTCLSLYKARFSAGSLYANDRADLVFVYRLYQRLMAHWRAVLPPDRLLEVDYEELVRDREAVTRRIIAFCGLDWDPACLAPERNRRAVKTASVWQVRQPVYTSSIGRWRRYEPWLGPLRELLDEDEDPT